MANERGRNKRKREQKKIKRLERLLGLNLCACGGGHQLRCHGVCKEVHMNSKTKKVECKEMYQIDHSTTKSGGPRRPKRTWKYGRQKVDSQNAERERNENIEIKERHRKKRERDRLQR